MKTKIVYVLTSNHTDYYLEQLVISLHSLRIYNPDVEVIVVVDSKTGESITGQRNVILKYSSEIKVVKCPEKYTKQQCSRYLKTKLRFLIEGDFLFVDTDTIIVDNLEEIDNIDVIIGAVKDKHLALNEHPMQKDIKKWAKIVNWDIIKPTEPYFNSGVFYVKDVPEAYKFYEQWNDEWQKGANNGLNLDQPSLGKTNDNNDSLIKEIDGKWNCQITDNGLQFLSSAKIIHYFASMQPWDTKDEIPYLFRDRDIFVELRNENNIVNEQLNGLILNAKCAFKNKCTILSGRNISILDTKLYKGLRSLYFKHHSIYRTIDIVIDKLCKIFH